MSFSTLMEFVKEWVEMRTKALREQGDNTVIDKIVLNTEDRTYMEARLDYPRNETFPFDFIVNDKDVMQGTGNSITFNDQADQIMLNSFVAMKMQLFTESLSVNSCSNFHKMILDQSIHDCGVQNYVEIYHENNNPKYHMKCKWQH